MPRTPDRVAGPRHEEEIRFEGQTASPTVDGAMLYRSDTGVFEARDALGSFDPRRNAARASVIDAAAGRVVVDTENGQLVEDLQE